MWCGSFSIIYRGLYGRSEVFLCREDPRGNTAPSPSPNILKNWCNIHSETIFSRFNVCILSKGVGGGGGVIREFLSCNFWGISTHLIASSCLMYPLVTTSIGSADIDGTGLLGFILFYCFLVPPYFSPFSSSRSIFSYVPPIASSLSPSLIHVHCTLSTPHFPARRPIAVVVTEPWIWRPIR